MDLKQVIQTLESGNTFSLRAIQANVKKGTGGQILEIPKARIARNRNPIPQNSPKTEGTREPNHNANFTRNIELLPSRRIITVHPILITHINKEAVV